MNSKNNFYKFIFCAVFLSALFFIAPLALAEESKEESKIVSPWESLQVKIPGLDTLIKTDEAQVKCYGEGAGKVCEYPWIGIYAKAIYNFSVGVSGILAVIVMMAGGYYWLFAGGNASRVGKAKELIGGAAAGLALALGSYMILNLINPDLLYFKSIRLGIPAELKVMQKLAEDKTGKTADDFEAKECSASGTYQAYFTAYCKPNPDLFGYDKLNKRFRDAKSKDEFFCYVGLNCSCPAFQGARDKLKNCWNNPNHHPCYEFDPTTTPYCDTPAMPGAKLSEANGSLAVPRCIPFGTAICIDGKKYYAHDLGGAQTITGRHFDMWKDDCKNAISPGTKTITVLSNPGDACP